MGSVPPFRHAEFNLAGLAPQGRHAELVSASIPETSEPSERWTLKQVKGDALLGAMRQSGTQGDGKGLQ